MKAAASLMIITDGSTEGKSDGGLARALVKELFDWFATNSTVSAEKLRDLHPELGPTSQMALRALLS